ncbi:PAS domain-containing protein [Dankookia rubra]|uniref:histidine kinase n=1 Tax=Dankookia rubra TaxID=1442381 RepID=A0A4R5Q6K4_9PROT|nr:PAS domain S-box protein [Dankookia rubra]TDH58490.1 PAS domain-containing protein [Dankookia rubra]
MPVSSQPRNREGQAAAERVLCDIEARNGPFVAAVQATRVPMVVTDPRIAGNPIIYANDAFVRMCGYKQADVLGQDYFFLLGEHASPEVAGRVEAAIAAGLNFIEDVPFRTKDGREVWVSMFVSPVSEGDRVVQHFASFLDISERVAREWDLRAAKETLDRRVATRTRRLQEVNARLQEEVERRQRTEAALRDALAQGEEDIRYRDFLIREVNHRTKNALQLAASLLGVQARHVQDPHCRDALEAAMGRLRRVGGVHALLTYQTGSPNAVDCPDYLRRLCREMEEGLSPLGGRVTVEVETEEEAVWSPDLVLPLGLIVGEAVTNALKYAFPDGREGQVRVELHANGDGTMRLLIEDDGAGMSAERRAGSFGLRLIEMFAKQVKGRAVMEAGRGGQGTAVVVTFPDPDAAPG